MMEYLSTKQKEEKNKHNNLRENPLDKIDNARRALNIGSDKNKLQSYKEYVKALNLI